MNIVFELSLPLGVRLQVVGPLTKEHEGKYLWMTEGVIIFGRGYKEDQDEAIAAGLACCENVLKNSMVLVLQAKAKHKKASGG